MTQQQEENEGDDAAGSKATDAPAATTSSFGDAEALSLYDSLLRGVAAGTSSVRIDAEVGPHGKFVLQQEIGSGAMGRVFRATDRDLLRDVAIKFILRPEGMNHDDFMALFWQEAHIIARLDHHDNIVRILDVDRASYPPFIVMEYLDGQSLEKLLRRDRVELATALHIMIAAARGLREAHDKGIFHRDLKPSNIFVQNTGRVKLLDFGLARIRNQLFERSASKARFVTTHSVPPLASAGTPAYMAPEQWRGEDADAATDLWAIGAILYRLLANALPFEADSLAGLSARVLSGDPPPPLSDRCPDAPAEVCDLVERLLNAECARRPNSASDVIAVLETSLRRISSESPDVASAPPVSASRSPALPRSSPPWPTATDQRFAHGSGPDARPRQWEKLLLVLVSSSGTRDDGFPEQLSAWILRSAAINLGVLHHPPSNPGDIASSAARLKVALEERFNRPRHFYFVTHGEGTRVVLQMLLDEASRLRSRGPGTIDLDVRSPFYRARHVAIVGSGSGVSAAHHAPGHTDPHIARLIAEVTSQARYFLAAGLPAPALYHVGTDHDQPALHAGSPSVRWLASLLVQPETMVARETIAQTFELDCAAKIVSLVGPADPATTSDAHSTVSGADGVTQLEAFEEIVALARSQHQRPEMIVIAGDTGVGKSTVLRTTARHLGNELIASPDGNTPVPILLSLHFANLTSEHLSMLHASATEHRRGLVLHDVLLSWWCSSFNDITFPGAISIEWLRTRLRSEPTTLIFDGVDEFIANNPTLGIADFHQMVAALRFEYQRNSGLTIVLGVRSTQPGLPALGASRIREILRLTKAQATRQFPAALTWLSAKSNAPVEKLLLTPLILAHLNTRRPPSTSKPGTQGELVLLALEMIIEQSDLPGKLDQNGQPIDAQRWIDALMAVAWCMFRRLRGELATTTLELDAAELFHAWQRHLESTGQEAQGATLLSAFHLLCESKSYEALLHRTVLYPTARGEIQFIHREWQDFLAARYLAQAVVYRNVDEFRHVGNTARICQMAGELLCRSGVCIDEDLVLALLARARTLAQDDHQAQGARLITANFSGILTNARLPIDGPAIEVFISAVHTMPAIARCITLSGLGYRALRHDDASAPDLRHRLLSVFRDYATDAVAGDDHEVMRSIAWCYRKAYAARFGGPPFTDAWPGLDDHAERSALAMMCPPGDTGDKGRRFHVEQRSVQIALLEVQQVVPDDPLRPISGIHYLYLLAVARRHGVGIAELSRELPVILAPGSLYGAAIESYQLVPELREVLAACRRLALAP